MHDLHTITKPIPPYFKIGFELARNPSDIFICKGASETDQYKVILEDIALFVPKTTLSISIVDGTSSYHNKRFIFSSGIAAAAGKIFKSHLNAFFRAIDKMEA